MAESSMGGVRGTTPVSCNSGREGHPYSGHPGPRQLSHHHRWTCTPLTGPTNTGRRAYRKLCWPGTENFIVTISGLVQRKKKTDISLAVVPKRLWCGYVTTHSQRNADWFMWNYVILWGPVGLSSEPRYSLGLDAPAFCTGCFVLSKISWLWAQVNIKEEIWYSIWIIFWVISRLSPRYELVLSFLPSLEANLSSFTCPDLNSNLFTVLAIKF